MKYTQNPSPPDISLPKHENSPDITISFVISKTSFNNTLLAFVDVSVVAIVIIYYYSPNFKTPSLFIHVDPVVPAKLLYDINVAVNGLK